MAQTKLTNLINPEVMGDMISAGLPKAIKFLPIAKLDDKLEGQPGNTITIPVYTYIGDAKDVAEGVAIDLELMATTTKPFTIKKAAKGVEITDEALLSGFGDPIGNATQQLKLSIASKLDEDIVKALGTATANKTVAAAISYAGIVDAVGMLVEEDATEKYIFIHPDQMTTLRKDENFISAEKYGGQVMMTGEIGMIAGCRVVKSRRVPSASSTFTNFIVAMTPEAEDGTPVLPAVSIFVKRDVLVENDRDIVRKTNVITADEHYVVGLTNDSKVVKVTFNK